MAAAAPSEPSVWLFAYFHHPGRDGLRFAWSRDGYRWADLAGGRPVLEPRLGPERLLRDPFVLPTPDGRYHLVFTIGWAGRSIGHAWSEDLVHWSEQREVPVMAGEPDAANCWAPEIAADPASGGHLVFWSTTIPGRYPGTDGQRGRNHRIYCAPTADFERFGPSRLLYDPGFNVIDADILPHAGRFLLFMKNETGDPLPPEKNIRFASAPAAAGPYGSASPPITGPYWAEGPCAIHLDGHVMVYFDKHREGRYGAVRSRDLRTWEDVSDRLAFPPLARHGHVFAVAESVVARLAAGGA